jgi:hypothetical protein
MNQNLLPHAFLNKTIYKLSHLHAIPHPRVHHIRPDLQRGNACCFQRAFRKKRPRCRRPRTARHQQKRAVNAMLFRLFKDPFVHPRRIVQLLIHTHDTARQRAQGIIKPIANITIRPERKPLQRLYKTRCHAIAPRRPTSTASVHSVRRQCPVRHAL